MYKVWRVCIFVSLEFIDTEISDVILGMAELITPNSLSEEILGSVRILRDYHSKIDMDVV